MATKDGRIRKNLQLGMTVQVVLKQDQKSGHLTKGKIAEFLTNTAKHPHGIKVRLASGKIGRVQKILSTSKKNATRTHESSTKQPPARSKVSGHLRFLDY